MASGRCSGHQLYHVAGQYNSSGMRHSAVEQEEEEEEEEEEEGGRRRRQACTPPPRPQRHLTLCRGTHKSIPSIPTLPLMGGGVAMSVWWQK